MAGKMEIECPAPACRRRFEDRDRSSLLGPLGPDTGAVEVNRNQEATTNCPACGQVVEFGLLMRDDDGLWRVSAFAGHADDVTLQRPPGGGVDYEAPERQPVYRPTGLSAGELKMRDRALAALDGRTPAVPIALQRDTVALALDAGVLEDDEIAQARAWLERTPG